MNVSGSTSLARTIVFEDFHEVGVYRGASRVAFAEDRLKDDVPDAHCFSIDHDGVVAARCSLWWRDTPVHSGSRVGCIGHYVSADDDAAARLIAQAEGTLKGRGCKVVIAPMDGNTWRHYRFVIEKGAEPAFWSEPQNPPAWPEQFRRAGYRPAAFYISGLNDNLAYEDPVVVRAAERLRAASVQIRCLNPAMFEEELRRIFDVSCISFQANPFYTPMSWPEFLRHYQRIFPHVVPELVLLAEREGRCVGYVFMMPDLAQRPTGQAGETAILKTVAVVPERACSGLGAVLVAQGQVAARRLGFRRVVHALMHEANASVNISRRFARPIRRYALFSRNL